MSQTTASKDEVRAASNASRPERTHVTRKPLCVSPVSSIKRIECSSSATRMWGGLDISCTQLLLDRNGQMDSIDLALIQVGGSLTEWEPSKLDCCDSIS